MTAFTMKYWENSLGIENVFFTTTNVVILAYARSGIPRPFCGKIREQKNSLQ